MSLEVLNGLNLAVGGNQAANGTTLNRSGVNGKRRAAGEDGDEDSGGDDSGGQPGVAAAARRMSIRIVVVRRQILYRERFPRKRLRQAGFASTCFLSGRCGNNCK